MPATMVRGAQTTANVNTSQHVRDVAEGLKYLDPDIAPFTLILSKERSVKADLFKFEWIEKGGDFAGAGFAPKLDQVNNGAGYAAGATAIVVDNSEYFQVHDLIKVPRTAEVMRVTAATIATDTLTVVRAVGSTAAAALVDNDDLFILGTSYAEGASVGAGIDHQEAYKFNYAELKRTPLEASMTQQLSRSYIGQPRTRLRMEKLKEHRVDLERAFLFGERNRDTSDTSAPRNYTGGFLYWATSNNLDINGTLTESEVWSFAEDVFAHTAGGSSRTLYSAPGVISVIDLIAGARMETMPGSDQTYGISVRRWVTGHGDFLIVKHRLLESGAGAASGGSATPRYGEYALACNTRSLAYRYIRNTQLLTDRQAPGDDKWVDEYLSEAGLQFENAALHGVMSEISA